MTETDFSPGADVTVTLFLGGGELCDDTIRRFSFFFLRAADLSDVSEILKKDF